MQHDWGVEFRMTWFEWWFWWLIVGTIIAVIVLIPVYIWVVKRYKKKELAALAQPKARSPVCEYCGSPMAQTDIVCNKCGRARSQKIDY